MHLLSTIRFIHPVSVYVWATPSPQFHQQNMFNLWHSRFINRHIIEKYCCLLWEINDREIDTFRNKQIVSLCVCIVSSSICSFICENITISAQFSFAPVSFLPHQYSTQINFLLTATNLNSISKQNNSAAFPLGVPECNTIIHALTQQQQQLKIKQKLKYRSGCCWCCCF